MHPHNVEFQCSVMLKNIDNESQIFPRNQLFKNRLHSKDFSIGLGLVEKSLLHMVRYPMELLINDIGVLAKQI